MVTKVRKLCQKQRDLLPLPLPVISHAPRAKGGRKRARLRSQRECEIRLKSIIEILNTLHLGVVEGERKVAELNSAQSRSILYLKNEEAEACRLFGGGPSAVHAVPYDLGQFGYNEVPSDVVKSVGEYVWLDIDQIALPKGGVAGVADTLKLLPDDVRRIYSTPLHILSDNPVPPDSRKPFIGMDPKKYHALIMRLEANSLVKLVATRPRIINGIFAVTKGEGKQRLIIDARRANLQFKEPPKVKLPTPDLFTHMVVEDDQELFFMKADLDTYYYRLRLPEWMWPYFGLPPIRRDNVTLWPQVIVLPMGWSHSVYIGQQIHEQMLRNIGITDSMRFLYGDKRISGTTVDAYVDDFFGVGYDAPAMAHILRQYEVETLRCNLPTKPAKTLEPSSEATIIGTWWTADAKLRPKKEALPELVRYTLSFANRREWDRDDLESLLGKWAWFLLLKRAMFSIFFEVYKTLNRDKGKRAIAPRKSAREELKMLCILHPFLYTNLRLPYASITVASDASKWGGGVVYAQDTLGIKFIDLSLEEQCQWIDKQAWSVAIRHKWEDDEFIHILEGRAVILALRWLGRNPSIHGTRINFFIDNTALLGALRKGRSSKWSLNQICRSVVAICLAANMVVTWWYVPSKRNPADGPSRK